MYCYRITNKINNKKYIGITIDFERRMKQHQQQASHSLIHRAIVKYGQDNFSYEIIEEDLSVEEAEQKEIETIKNENTLVPNGYNLAKGGMHGGTKARITDKQIAYIKNHRDLPEYVLYDSFSDIICYGYFKQIYKNRIRKDIEPTVDEYPDNVKFSCQFTKTKMTYFDIVEIRQAYADLINWKSLYPKYSNKVSEATFFDIFRGQQFQLIMPEVFSPEVKKKYHSMVNGGENNANAKLTEQDVKHIRILHQQHKTPKEISTFYPQVSYSTILDVVNYRTRKNL
mgnify:CR=1 FL=1